MTQASNSKVIFFFFLSAIFVVSCMGDSKSSNNLDKQDTKDSLVIDKELYYAKIDSFVNMFNREESIFFYEKKQSYPIEDSLCFYFSRLNRWEIIKDDNFKIIAGKLVEKFYLEDRKASEKPESFPVYNLSILTLGRPSLNFSVNIILNKKAWIDSTFVKYAVIRKEFICIDSVVLVLDKIPQMQNDSIHRICIDLVDRGKTGGCRW